LTIDAVLTGARVEENVIILDDTSFVEGLALAEFLSTSGKHVELVTRDPAPGLKLHWSLQLPYVYERALKSGVLFTPNSFVREIRRDSILVYNIYTAVTSERRLDKTTVVLVTGRVPLNETADFFRGTGTRIVTVGDCNLAGREMGDVIAESFDALREI
jgi:hypothetical protein